MNVKVLKYGGTSVGTTAKIKKIAKELAKRHNDGERIIVVVSAMGKTTDELVKKAMEISESPDRREMDMLLSTGEQISISLLSMAIREQGIGAISLTGQQAGIITDRFHTRARILDVKRDRMLKSLEEDKIVVVAGFQGINELGDITTLGRGGSDTTAVSLAAAFGCTCEIYTDVDGVYSVDPRVYENAKKLDEISYEEMLEMASLGAGVLETRAVEMAHKFKVPLYVGQSGRLGRGTWIKEMNDNMENKAVTGLATSDDCVMVTLGNIPFEPKNIAMVFASLASENVLVDMISQTAPIDGHVSISFTGLDRDVKAIESILGGLKSESFPSMEYTLDDSVIKLSVVGIGMVSQSGVAAGIFDLFATNGIRFHQVTTSEISISYTISKEDKDKAVRLIAYKFDL